MDRRLRADLRKSGDFSRIHPLPESGQDVADDLDARLVVLRIDQPYSKEPASGAEAAAKTILESRGSAPRIYRNTLVFLAADKMRLQDLDEAVRRYLAWESIVAERETLDLSPHQVKQAETQLMAADSVVSARLPETYQWLLVPVQSSPQAPVEFEAVRLTGQDSLAVRASKKLKNDDRLITSFGPTSLRIELDRVPLWRGNHVEIEQLVEDFARYLYLSRLQGPEVLRAAVRDGIALITWEKDSFAFAESFDESAGRYRGLQFGRQVSVEDGLLVRPDIARKQIEEETTTATPEGGQLPTRRPDLPPEARTPEQERPAAPTRFHGSVTLDPTRVGRDASRIADEVISHLAGLLGTSVKVTLEIEAQIPTGAPENVVRTVTENSRTLKFSSQGFESE